MALSIRDEVVGLALKLLAIPSENPPGAEKAVAEVIQDFIRRELGIEPISTGITEDRPNIVAVFGSGHRGLLLNGHMDTVPVGDPAHWLIGSPWGKVQGAKLYGRGACDMKGALAAILVATKCALSKHQVLHRPLVLAFTVDEEVACHGAYHLVHEQAALFQDVAAAVIGEPTDLMVKRMHKGSIHFSLSIPGRAAHSSNPELGINAIIKAAEVIRELECMAEDLKARTDETGHPTLNIGCISGGSSIYIVPDRCIIEIDRRYLPSETPDSVATELQELLNRRLAGCKLTWTITSRPLKVAENSEIVRLLETLTGSLSGAAGFYTEAPIYGELSIPAVLLGPGSIKQAHQPDEYVEIDHLERAVRLYETLIKRWCM